MITERAFAASFPDFWQGLLPLLTPSCVHLLNSSYEEHLQDVDGQELPPVDASDETRDAAIVTEFAYHLAREAFTRHLSVCDAFNDACVQRAAEEAALDLINRYEGRQVLPGSTLNASELEEGLQLAFRYESFARMQGGPSRFAFQVPIKGCGFIHACAADLTIGDYLVEVKTVKRTLAGKDIRQLLVYLTLSSATQPTRWQSAGFLNPRRSTYHQFPIHELIDLMSGGRSLVDLYTDLMEFACASDIQMDSRF